MSNNVLETSGLSLETLLRKALSTCVAEREELDRQINAIRANLHDVTENETQTETARIPRKQRATNTGAHRKGISEEGRKRIAEAQRARWKKYHANGNGKTAPAAVTEPEPEPKKTRAQQKAEAMELVKRAVAGTSRAKATKKARKTRK